MTTSKNNLIANAIDTEIYPFEITIPQADLDDLRNRLANSRWPNARREAGWKYGVSSDYVKGLAEYWMNEYDWRKHEARLNTFPQFTTAIDGANIHFMHVRSPEPDALPLLLTHSWPSSIVEFWDLIGPLSNPRAFGGDPANAFHLVIPSVPGFGFSGPELDEGWNIARIAKAWTELMSRLGYEKYGSHGSDCGALVSRELGIQKPEGLLAIQVLQLFSFPSGDPSEMADLSEDDMSRLQFLANFHERAGYNAIQQTRPQTLAYGLADSPIGQLAWIAELFNGFGDHIDFIDRDALLTNVMIYWLTNTAESSARLYYENAHQQEPSPQAVNTTPTGVSVFGHDFKSMKRFANRDNTNIVQWSEFKRGTHFAALDAPDLLVPELQDFFRRYR
ncbi:pimeloyl-ACP methyl ester carboxylesterase [Paenibacillus endophyticus]|uniref:Pimeloyl-ACP methyl ester carboxylesterase n=1 Tax=Paenibacillus endophyticus TaxID=1294268 RepID=A0A7W5C980_9BACL|nr:epoxide hydrolase family protein [Paenibacillus endophyticus]MBB3153418.1 pimeloyl-ACP methyl ester carboxylesterase [Paenibacillus endophyticus]